MKQKHLEMHMRVAEAVAETSSAVRLKVGAVAVKNNRIIGTGYNGLSSGYSGACENKIYEHEEHSFRSSIYTHGDNNGRYRLETRKEVNHAELNLILNLARSTESSVGCSVFLTHSCCSDCSKLLLDSGVEAVYYKHLYRSDEGIKYLKANNVTVEKLEDYEISL